ncbi:hypothetical protein [Lentilactobacillus hilgardii]|uniref:hypothetical protein n=1 Tax=Lentilactobacillus hilgardii TaxID=1588 RepID=UPI0021A5592C|nr:hypothetical protein [Lentilactobacillus hilgardii]MCT3390391.1 hypothetical protein [Lentilactobacillus hilgardii]
MSEYHDSQLTAFGADLAQRASNGDTKFTITKATSTADDLSQTDLSQLITLPHEKQTGEIDRILPDPNGGTKVKGTKVSFDNLNLTESYPIQAMALYAKEDVDGAKEQLYAVTTAADPETMPKSDSAVMFTFSASIYVIVGNTSQVTINVNPDSFATKEYVADAIANINFDTSDLAKLSQDNYYTGDNQFKYDPVNKDGDAYGLAKDIDTKVTDNGDGSIVVNGKTYTPADDSKVVHSTDMRKPASDVAGIEEVSSKQDKIGYTPADDSKVAHLSGANNFDTVPTVDNNPLLLASSLPSDLARTGQAQTFTQPQTFSIAPVINDASTSKGGNQAATMADLKSVENSAWHDLITTDVNGSFDVEILYQKIVSEKELRFIFIADYKIDKDLSNYNFAIDLSKIITTFQTPWGASTQYLSVDSDNGSNDYDFNANSGSSLITCSKPINWTKTAGALGFATSFITTRTNGVLNDTLYVDGFKS